MPRRIHQGNDVGIDGEDGRADEKRDEAPHDEAVSQTHKPVPFSDGRLAQSLADGPDQPLPQVL